MTSGGEQSMRSTWRLAVVTILVVVTAALSAGCGGSSKPKETFKQAQAAVAKPFANLMNTLASQESTGIDKTAAEVRETDQLIAAVNEHRPALGLHEARRSLAVTLYTLNVGGVHECPPCQQKLHAAADALK